VGILVPGCGVRGGPGLRPHASARPPARELHVPVVSCSLLFFPQIEADFRLNGEYAPLPRPVQGPQPPVASPAPGPSRAEDRHGVPETKSRLLAYRPHCSHRAASGPPFQGPQLLQIAAFPRGGSGDPASPAAELRGAFPGRDSSRESRLVDGRDLVSAPFSFSLSSPFCACVFLSHPRLLS
jgi:hypothetical protein